MFIRVRMVKLAEAEVLWVANKMQLFRVFRRYFSYSCPDTISEVENEVQVQLKAESQSIIL